MRAGSSPVRCTIARATMAPSSSTGTPFNAPPYAPTGVRSGETIAARFIALPLNVLHESTVASARHMQHFATDQTRALTGKKSHGVGDIVGMSGTLDGLCRHSALFDRSEKRRVGKECV